MRSLKYLWDYFRAKKYYGLECPFCKKAAFYYDKKPSRGELLIPKYFITLPKVPKKLIYRIGRPIFCQYCFKPIPLVHIKADKMYKFNFKTGERL